MCLNEHTFGPSRTEGHTPEGGNMRKLLLSGVLAMVVLSICAQAQITIGNPPNSENCIPWSCAGTYPGNYEQIYYNSSFNNPVDINSISFFNTYYNNGPSQGIANEVFSLYLATTSMTVPNGSIPSGAQLFGNYTLNGGSWPFGQELTFNGAPYLYNPGSGNLELIVEVTSGSNPNSGVFTYFDANSDGPFSRWGQSIGSDEGYGLVTEFGTASGTVPEPSTLMLLGSGFAALGMLRRKLL
jgi:hypothetical protein